ACPPAEEAPALEPTTPQPHPMPKETVTTPSSPNRTASARSAYASRTFGRYAVGLRPILDPHASLAFTPTTSEKNKHGQQRNPAHLTGPAPSGMTQRGPRSGTRSQRSKTSADGSDRYLTTYGPTRRTSGSSTTRSRPESAAPPISARGDRRSHRAPAAH